MGASDYRKQISADLRGGACDGCYYEHYCAATHRACLDYRRYIVDACIVHADREPTMTVEEAESEVARHVR